MCLTCHKHDMKNLTMFLPDSTHETLNVLAKSAGIELTHFCSNVLTDYAADSQHAQLSNQKKQRSNGGFIHANKESNTSLPHKTFPEAELLKEVVMFLRKQGGSTRKVLVEKAVYEKNRSELSHPHWQELVGGNVPRWQKNTQFASNTARKMGLMKSPEESGRGIWELTEKGRKWNFE